MALYCIVCGHHWDGEAGSRCERCADEESYVVFGHPVDGPVDTVTIPRMQLQMLMGWAEQWAHTKDFAIGRELAAKYHLAGVPDVRGWRRVFYAIADDVQMQIPDEPVTLRAMQANTHARGEASAVDGHLLPDRG